MILKTELARLEVEIDDAVFTLQELSTTALTEIAVIAVDNKAASLLPTFMGALVGWQNVTDESGKPLPFTEENKRAVFEANKDLAERLLQQLPAIEQEIEAQKKFEGVV